jgi:hypothetical protein
MALKLMGIFNIKLAIDIFENHNNRIEKYMKDWFEIGTSNQRIKQLSRSKALKEQIARGFMNLGDIEFDPDLPYIISIAGNYALPKQWANKPNVNLCGIYEKLLLYSVSGWTGIKLPKKINGK